MSNKTVENDAIKEVIKYLKEKERILVVNRVTKKGYDLDAGNRKIEVKGSTKRENIQLNGYNLNALNTEPNFWLYYVCDLGTSSPIVIPMNRQTVKEMMSEPGKAAVIKNNRQFKEKFLVPKPDSTKAENQSPAE